jgi:hypothetical protein
LASPGGQVVARHDPSTARGGRLLSDQNASIRTTRRLSTGKEAEMATRQEMSTASTGWAGFAAIMLMILGTISFFEGLIAIVRRQYYVISGSQVIVFDVRTWGWLTLICGIVLVCAAFALLAGSAWARWFTIIVVAVNLIGQLGFLGASQYPLWTLVVIALDIMVLYALTARWEQAESV